MTGALKPSQRQQWHQVSGMQAWRGRVETRIDSDRPALDLGGQGIEVSGLCDQSTPAQLVEDRGVHSDRSSRTRRTRAHATAPRVGLITGARCRRSRAASVSGDLRSPR